MTKTHAPKIHFPYAEGEPYGTVYQRGRYALAKSCNAYTIAFNLHIGQACIGHYISILSNPGNPDKAGWCQRYLRKQVL